MVAGVLGNGPARRIAYGGDDLYLVIVCIGQWLNGVNRPLFERHGALYSDNQLGGSRLSGFFAVFSLFMDFL